MEKSKNSEDFTIISTDTYQLYIYVKSREYIYKSVLMFAQDITHFHYIIFISSHIDIIEC